MQPIRIRDAIKPVTFLLISIMIFAVTNTLLWLPFLMLAVFYSFVVFRRIDKDKGVIMENLLPDDFGKLDKYVVDSEESLGLFVKLNGKAVFIDLREDELLEQRKKFALFLCENINMLEKSLNEFFNKNSDFSDKHLTYIGLHANDVRQGEVFWEHGGYTILRELLFTLD